MYLEGAKIGDGGCEALDSDRNGGCRVETSRVCTVWMRRHVARVEEEHVPSQIGAIGLLTFPFLVFCGSADSGLPRLLLSDLEYLLLASLCWGVCAFDGEESVLV